MLGVEDPYEARRAKKRKNRAPAGTNSERISDSEIKEVLREIGDPDADYAKALDKRVGDTLPALASLSPLTSPLVVDYVNRVAGPIKSMSPSAGARVVARGYVAHVVAEKDPKVVGAPDVPVLGDLPPLDKRGQPPRDLMMRIVKASRRHFERVCALTLDGWDAFVMVSLAHVHDDAELLAGAGGSDTGEQGGAGGKHGEPDGPAYLSEEVVDGLLRTGWLLRQVDLAYGQDPEWS